MQPPKSPAAPRRTAAFSLLWLCLLVAPALAEKPLPFPPEWEATVEKTFFEDGELSATKLSSYRQDIEQRRDEVRDLLVEDYRDRGKSKKSIRKRLERKKLLVMYRTLLGDSQTLGMIGRLWDETDSTAARLLASRILEVDYALRVEGARPLSRDLVDYLSSAALLHWIVEPRSHADQVDREASNLWNPESGLFYEPEDLRKLIESGQDISALGPPPDSTFWQAGSPIGERSVREMFYEGGSAVHANETTTFPLRRARLDKIRLSQTKPKFEIEVGKGKSKRTFKLKVGAEIHSEPTVNSLLATLGFNIDLTHYVRDFRLDLDDDTSAEDLRNDWRSYFENHRTHNRFAFDDYFIEGRDADGAYLFVREGALEWKPPQIERVGPWPFGGNGHDGEREVRGLGLFSVWIGNTDLKEAENNKLVARSVDTDQPVFYHLHHDLGHSLGRMVNEQLGAFPWDLVLRTPGGKIKFNYHSVQPTSLRTRITYADARWMTRLIAQLSRRQIAQAVAMGHWPRSAAELLIEKLIHRRNQLVEAFDLIGEPTPSGPIALLEVDRYLTTDDGAVVDGEFATGRFEGSTQEFDNYWEELLGPVWDRLVLFVAAQVQRSVGAVPEIVFDERSVGFPKALTVELLVNFKRTTDENLRPTSSRDYYVTNDTFLLGARLGGGFVVRGEVAYARKYSLLTPAGTESQAQFANNTIFNLLLPWQVYTDDLPDEYVLVREDFIEARGRAITDDISGGAAWGGADATLARVRVGRDVVSVRDGRVQAYRDTSVFNETGFRAFLKAVFVRIPLATYANLRGDRRGEFYDLTEALAAHPEQAEAALDVFIRTGDAEPLDAVTDRTEIETDFQYRTQNVGAFDFISSEEGHEFENVSLWDPLAEAEAPERFRQLRVFRSNAWRFIDIKEAYRWSVQTLAAADSDAPTPIVLQFIDADGDTWSSELGDSYVGFINGVASAGRSPSRRRRSIDFTPELHSANERWGHVRSIVEIGFSPEAVEAMLALDADTYWRQLARELGTSDDRLRRYRSLLSGRGKRAMTNARKVPFDDRRPIRHSVEMMRFLSRARSESASRLRDGLVAEALAATIFRRGGGFDPRVLSVLREIIGPDAISIDARITQPIWKEKRLVGGVDLVLHTHDEPVHLDRQPILFAPRGPVQTYDMLDSFEPKARIDDKLRYGTDSRGNGD